MGMLIVRSCGRRVEAGGQNLEGYSGIDGLSIVRVLEL